MKKATLVLISIYLLIYIIPLGHRSLAIIDEARYAEIPREMIVSGNWVVPHLNGLRYFEKPVMGYWLNALSLLAFGENAFAARFPSALAVGATALLLFFLVKRSTHTNRMALLSAAMMLTFVIVCAVGVTNVLDSMLTFFITGMLVFFYFAYTTDETKWKIIHLILCGIFAYFSFMTKGFLAFVVPLITVVPFLLWQKDWKRIFTMPWIPLLVAILLILPWALMIHLREPDFWSYFFWEEHINRFLPESLNHLMHESETWRNLLGEKVTNRLVIRETQHEEPIWYFLPILLGGALPWSFVLPAAFTGLWKTRRRDPLLRFALCWFIFPFLFFSASSGKLGTYILPCFPALAIIGGCGLFRYFETGAYKSFSVGAFFTAGLFALTSLVLLLNYFTGIPEAIFKPDELGKFIMVVCGALLAAVLLFFAARTKKIIQRVILMALAPALLLFLAHFALPRRLAVTESAESFLMQHRDRARHAMLAVNKYLTHSVAFFYQRDDISLFDGRGEFEYGLSYPEANERLMTMPRFEEEVNYGGRMRPFIVILDTEHYLERKNLMQKEPPSFQATSKNGKLMLLQYD